MSQYCPSLLHSLVITNFNPRENLFRVDSRCLCFQAENVVVCEIDPALKDLIKKFRFRKETNNAAIISKL
jgi:predicted amidophosphoribosyltransferase